MPVQSLPQFVQSVSDKPHDHGMFELENDYLLQINLNGLVWIKMGSMVAYRGSIKFEREGLLAGGVGNLLKKAVSGEGARLSKATGSGALFLADKGKRVSLIQLDNEAIIVNGSDLLAFQDGIANEVTMMRKVSAIASGGLFNVRLSGRGVIAITTHHHPIALQVSPGNPVFTDPNATVAWSANLQPQFKTDIQFKTLLGRGSGESFQMHFEGHGFVLVQPYEESPLQADT
jgi:uncharacterized protein (AIM24 family)